ncbi:DUF262 domain-containing protein [Campylobacter coli]|nr:DUF262 domain-containing protein [Campylobacter coli]EDC4845576.1 DUF262 domain-containing protein [Campylobacter coli]EDK0147058.1 DUF262 domain-containing protein [Campylobacter coli]
MEFKPKKEYVCKLLSDEGVKFVIPEYQRPYRWGIDECKTLWNDILEVFGDGENISEYFLGSIVAYQNDKNELEIIDGQQRITTFTLFFRAFYEHFRSEQANVKISYLEGFGKCIWEYDLDHGLDYSKSHLSSRVNTDCDNIILNELLNKEINLENLRKSNSRYAKNFNFFYDKLLEFKTTRTFDWEMLCKMFLSKTLFTLIVICDSQESAMTIFNTLNSRGLPLSNADILKGYIYKRVSHKNEFANEWKDLEAKIDESDNIKNLDFLFLQFMHVIRAENKDFDTTTHSVLNFFTKSDKKVYYGAIDNWLYRDNTMYFIKSLANFWDKPENYLSDLSNKYMKILNLFQNDSWKAFVSCLVWRNKDNIDNKDEFSKEFDKYLPILIQYVTLAFLNGNASINVIKEIVFKMNVKLKTNESFLAKQNIPSFENFLEVSRNFDSRKTKYILFLYAYIYDDFKQVIDSDSLEVEHILPKQWQNANFNEWDEQSHFEYLENIGNKILLPKKSNIKCIDNFFAKKQIEYSNSNNANLKEVLDLSKRTKNIWIKEDIDKRAQAIYLKMVEFLQK